VILAGTELPLLLTKESTSSTLPLLDTTEIHVKAAIKQLLHRWRNEPG
jgi:aspartate/glutamate racemase